ncbi:enoyl-CoA hydratase/isomerase family protein [Falsiroseomonas sp. CW058]|uniref:enoyl-CoA hydratase/isomerase family protein n=1 Tax=Falsiroseomonas sp. CW058 TaxID=3388664 RepID=UPI003D3210F7
MTLRQGRSESGVLRLVLDRPHAANALDSALHDALVAALAAAAADAAARSVVLAAAGGRVFSAGADLREVFDLPAEAARARRRALLLRTLLAVLDFPKPLVALVRGKAVGGGAMLALLADEVVMEDGASLSMPELGIGMPSPIGLAIIAARAGRGAAFRLVQAGRPLAAAEALREGLADLVLPGGEAEAAAIARAAALGAFDAGGFATNKSWMNAELRAALPRAAAHAEAAHAPG